MIDKTVNLEYLFDLLILSSSKNMEFQSDASCKLNNIAAKIQFFFDQGDNISIKCPFGIVEMSRNEFAKCFQNLADSRSKCSAGLKRFFPFIVKNNNLGEELSM